MNAQAKTYKVKSSASRAAKKALGHDNFEVVELTSGEFVYNDLTDLGGDIDKSVQIEKIIDDGIEAGKVPLTPADQSDDEQGPPTDLLAAGDNAANGLTITEAPAGDKVKLDVKRRSDIEKPTKKVWAFAESILEAEPTIRRKDMIDRLVGMGIAFYTARTQYQLYLAAVKAQSGPALAEVKSDADLHDDGEE